jgi:hypothetical protein
MAGLLGDVLPYIYSRGNALRRGLLDTIQNPVASMEQTAGLLQDKHREQQNVLAQAFADPRDPFKVTDKRAMNQAATNMLMGPLGLAPMGITAWHGSPHKFDKFDSSKIGTGEGAQAYGHGLYLAESKDVAQNYQNVLSTGKNARFNGSGYKVVADDTGRSFAIHTDNIADDFRGGVPYSEEVMAGIPSLDAALRIIKNKTGADDLRYYDMDRFPLHVPWSADDVLNGEVLRTTPAGNLYKVDLPDDAVAKMLDWDKPLSQQSPAATAAIDKFVANYGPLYPKLEQAWKGRATSDWTGKDLYRAVGGQQKNFGSDLLRNEVGLPGIRYLDGGSRDAGNGSSNFVVFPGEENILSILERNGQPVR